MFNPTIKRETFRRALLTSVLLCSGAGMSFADVNAGSAAFNNGNYVRAYQEFKQSADAGNSVAQYMMGRLYAEGYGVDQDKATAYMWFDLSASNGNNRAIAARDAVAAQMESDEIDHAQELATAWRADHAAPSTVGVAAPAVPVSPPLGAPYSLSNVQVALSDLGYVVGTPDGVIGPKSRAAIRAYQADSGLPTSGEPSRALYEKLQASVAQRSGQAAKPVQQPATSTVSEAMVTEAQTELRRRGYAISAITGSSNTETVAAVREYQSDAHLPVTGTISDPLLQQLRSASADSGAVYRARVKQVQASLNTAGYSAGPPDGALGPKSRAAISRYQTDNRLAATGDVNAELLASLGIENNDDAATSAMNATTRDIKQALQQHGYASGTLNGSLDPVTQDSIRAYQKDAGLEVTGKATPELLQHLRQSDIRNSGEKTTQMVRNVEELLQRQGYAAGPVDGVADDRTRAAIRAYQGDNGLAMTGDANDALLAQLQTSDGKALPSSSILEIQEALNSLGYLNRQGTGRMGPRSTAAIRRYQGDRGLVVDGLPSMSLLSKLRTEAVAKPITEPGAGGL